jgi:hypothetical protein
MRTRPAVPQRTTWTGLRSIYLTDRTKSTTPGYPGNPTPTAPAESTPPPRSQVTRILVHAVLPGDGDLQMACSGIADPQRSAGCVRDLRAVIRGDVSRRGACKPTALMIA